MSKKPSNWIIATKACCNVFVVISNPSGNASPLACCSYTTIAASVARFVSASLRDMGDALPLCQDLTIWLQNEQRDSPKKILIYSRGATPAHDREIQSRPAIRESELLCCIREAGSLPAYTCTQHTSPLQRPVCWFHSYCYRTPRPR